MKKISKRNFLNLGDKRTLTKTMRSSVNLCYKRPRKKRHYVALLCLIACGIDGLNRGEKSAYINTLKRYFPDLCKELGALEFYSKYRNGIVHEFTPKKGYAIVENHEINGKYVDDVCIEEKDRKIKFRGLNMDRLVKDFLNYLGQLEK